MIALKNPALPLLAPLVTGMGLSLTVAVVKRAVARASLAKSRSGWLEVCTYLATLYGVSFQALTCYLSWQSIVAQTEPMSYELRIASGSALLGCCQVTTIILVTARLLSALDRYKRRMINEFIGAKFDR